MVLKIVVTEDIDSFYSNVKKNYSFSVSRGTLVFYDQNKVSNFKLFYNKKEFVIQDNKINVNQKTNKYEVKFPKNLKCGKYNLSFNRSNDGTHKLVIFIFPKSLSNIYTKIKIQDLDVIDNEFENLIDNYNNSMKVLEMTSDENYLLIDQDRYDDYLLNMVKYLYENLPNDKLKIYNMLSCIGLLLYEANDTSTVLVYQKYDKFIDNLYNIISSNKLNKNIYEKIIIGNTNQNYCTINIDSVPNQEQNNTLLYEFVEIDKCSSNESTNYFKDNDKIIHYKKKDLNDDRQKFEIFFNQLISKQLIDIKPDIIDFDELMDNDDDEDDDDENDDE